MQLTSILLFLSATACASAFPALIETRDAAEANGTTSGPKPAAFACEQGNNILSEQLAEMAKLKAQNISVPPYLAGYYTAVSAGRQSIGCPGTLPVRRRDFTPKQEPCDVIIEQHDRMMALIDRFEKEKIGVAPFIAGFFSATLDGNKALGCVPFTGRGAVAPVVDAGAGDYVSGSESSF